jgi:hypothetical protein
MHFDRFDTERYQKYLEARNKDLKTTNLNELQKKENERIKIIGKAWDDSLELIQVVLYFILLTLLVIFLYKVA